MDRSPTTISRELLRNRSGDVYFAAQAYVRSQRRRRQRPLVRKIQAPRLNNTLRRGLTQYWSPEHIAGRLRREAPQDKAPISARMIHHWLESDEDHPHWESFRRRRGKRAFRRENLGGIGAPIAERPEVVEQRPRIGDLERDTVLGIPGTGGRATLVDRKSRYAVVVKIQSKGADHVHEQIKERLKQLDV